LSKKELISRLHEYEQRFNEQKTVIFEISKENSKLKNKSSKLKILNKKMAENNFE
jgi:predicted nuclease with TOPRIM domain